MEKSRSLDTLELSVFFLHLQEALKSTALGSPLQGSLSPPEPPALITQSVSTKWQHRDTQCSFVLVPPGTLKMWHTMVTEPS